MVKNDVLIKKWKAPLYNTSFWVVVGPSLEIGADTVEDLLDYRVMRDEHRGLCDAYMSSYYDKVVYHRIVILIKPFTTAADICHEAVHAVNEIFRYNGVKISTTNDEAQAYYTQWVVERIIKSQNEYLKIFFG